MNMIPGFHKILLISFFLFLSYPSHCEPIKLQVAEIQILNKITTKVKTYKILNNTSLNIDSLNIEVYACYKNPPDEIPENYVLLKIYDDSYREDINLIYQGWMISSSPVITPLEHPIYDLWLKDCKIDNDS